MCWAYILYKYSIQYYYYYYNHTTTNDEKLNGCFGGCSGGLAVRHRLTRLRGCTHAHAGRVYY